MPSVNRRATYQCDGPVAISQKRRESCDHLLQRGGTLICCYKSAERWTDWKMGGQIPQTQSHASTHLRSDHHLLRWTGMLTQITSTPSSPHIHTQTHTHTYTGQADTVHVSKPPKWVQIAVTKNPQGLNWMGRRYHDSNQTCGVCKSVLRFVSFCRDNAGHVR